MLSREDKKGLYICLATIGTCLAIFEFFEIPGIAAFDTAMCVAAHAVGCVSLVVVVGGSKRNEAVFVIEVIYHWACMSVGSISVVTFFRNEWESHVFFEDIFGTLQIIAFIFGLLCLAWAAMVTKIRAKHES